MLSKYKKEEKLDCFQANRGRVDTVKSLGEEAAWKGFHDRSNGFPLGMGSVHVDGVNKEKKDYFLEQKSPKYL